MQVTINNTPIEVPDGETILEAARRSGYIIPSLCYAKDAKHKSSCMVCAVKNCGNGQIIPSCTTYPTEGMIIETESKEVLLVRTLSLELLLSDHRADCEAPCSMVCPKGLDVEKMLLYYDSGCYEESYAEIAKAFRLPEIGCDTCKAPCEKACRRSTIDKPVNIRGIIKEMAGIQTTTLLLTGTNGLKKDKNKFFSRLGRFTNHERERLKQTTSTPSGCLHCACAGREGCKLRMYATVEGIKRPRYDLSSMLTVMNKTHVNGNIWFEQSKCIRCGICVYNSENGFTFKDRGFGMQVVLPEENKPHIKEELATLCPTGALYVADSKSQLTKLRNSHSSVVENQQVKN